jgi:hypothetical protein
MDKEQTAVEWLFNEITLQYVAKGNLSFMDIVNMSQQAKEMEKEQIINAFEQGENNSVDYFNPENRIKESENYYNETYGGNK